MSIVWLHDFKLDPVAARGGDYIATQTRGGVSLLLRLKVVLSGVRRQAAFSPAKCTAYNVTFAFLGTL